MKKDLNAKGNILVTITISMAVLGVISLGVSSVENMKRATGGVWFDRSYRVIENQFRATILNEVAWEDTIADGNNAAELDCIVNEDPPPTCMVDNTVIPGGIDFHGGDGAGVWYSSKAASPNEGFTYDGQRCDAFVPVGAEGNSDCPIRIEIELRTRCELADGNPCGKNSLDIVGTFRHNPGPDRELSIVNLDRATFTVNRSHPARLSPVNCTIMGSYDSGTSTCSLPVSDLSCLAGQALKGFVDGVPVCEDI